MQIQISPGTLVKLAAAPITSNPPSVSDLAFSVLLESLHTNEGAAEGLAIKVQGETSSATDPTESEDEPQVIFSGSPLNPPHGIGWFVDGSGIQTRQSGGDEQPILTDRFLSAQTDGPSAARDTRQPNQGDASIAPIRTTHRSEPEVTKLSLPMHSENPAGAPVIDRAGPLPPPIQPPDFLPQETAIKSTTAETPILEAQKDSSSVFAAAPVRYVRISDRIGATGGQELPAELSVTPKETPAARGGNSTDDGVPQDPKNLQTRDQEFSSVRFERIPFAARPMAAAPLETNDSPVHAHLSFPIEEQSGFAPLHLPTGIEAKTIEGVPTKTTPRLNFVQSELRQLASVAPGDPLIAPSQLPESDGPAVSKDLPPNSVTQRIVLPQTTDNLVATLRTHPNGRTRIRLSPEELGHVQFDLQTIGHKIHVVVQADRPDVLDFMRRHGDHLMSEMRAAGFSDTSLSFGSGSQSQGRTPTATPLFAPGAGFEAPQGPETQIELSQPKSSQDRLDLRL